MLLDIKASKFVEIYAKAYKSITLLSVQTKGVCRLASQERQAKVFIDWFW